jgi:cutinase
VVAVGPRAAKTIQQCIPDDPVCSLDGSNPAAHGQYATDGMVDQAADFAARRL